MYMRGFFRRSAPLTTPPSACEAVRTSAMRVFGNILALLVGIAGWYYLFYSKAAARLGAIEDPRLNLRRQRLRRTNGVVMLILAVLLYAGTDERNTPRSFALVWLSVF